MNKMKMIALLALLLSVVSAPVQAQTVSPFGVYDITASNTTSFAPLASGASITSRVFVVTGSQSPVVSWNLVTASGSPSLIMIVEQANKGSDTFGRWTAAPFSGATRNTSVTITTTEGGDALTLAQGALVRFTLQNGASQTVTPTLRMLVR